MPVREAMRNALKRIQTGEYIKMFIPREGRTVTLPGSTPPTDEHSIEEK
jgi:ketol-acid reductoisomerase